MSKLADSTLQTKNNLQMIGPASQILYSLGDQVCGSSSLGTN